MFKKILLTASLLMFLAAPVALAHEEEGAIDPGFLPGNPLYFIEIISEGFGSLFTFGAVAKAERSLELAEERLLEAHALADRGSYQRAEISVKKYEQQFKKALKKAGDVKEKALEEGADEIIAELEGLLAEITEATIKHQEVLGSIFQELSDGIIKDIENSIGVTAIGNNKEIDINVEQLSDFGGNGFGFGDISVLLDDLFNDEFDFDTDLLDEEYESEMKDKDDDKDHDMKKSDSQSTESKKTSASNGGSESEDAWAEGTRELEDAFEDLSDDLKGLEDLEDFEKLDF